MQFMLITPAGMILTSACSLIMLLSDSGWVQPDVRSRKGGRGFVHLSSCPLIKLSSVSSSKTV